MLKAAETRIAPVCIITAGDISGMPTGPKNYETSGMENMGTPTKIEPAFSLRTLIIGVLFIALFILLYFIFQGR